MVLVASPYMSAVFHAVIDAVKAIGLQQIYEIDMEKVNDMEKEAVMFRKWLDELCKYA